MSAIITNSVNDMVWIGCVRDHKHKINSEDYNCIPCGIPAIEYGNQEQYQISAFGEIKRPPSNDGIGAMLKAMRGPGIRMDRPRPKPINQKGV